VLCDNTVEIRRVAFSMMTPKDRFQNMGAKILRYDDDFLKKQKSLKDYKEKKDNYATIIFKLKQNPMNGWAIPFVTGHKYKIHWGQTGLDYDQMTVDPSERW
jgi:hypothetical protein